MEEQMGPKVDIYQGNINRKASGQVWLAVKTRKRIWNNSFKIRQELLEQYAEEIITDNHEDKAKIIKWIKDAKSEKRVYAMLRQYLKPDESRTSLSQVDVPE
eukprot:10025333-Ditylum_brightwellii.AAC.2